MTGIPLDKGYLEPKIPPPERFHKNSLMDLEVHLDSISTGNNIIFISQIIA